ncbi:AI-2E family transporter [Sagittula sp. MA-2]|uniref:AI-2E family transporter n=1 Tax=Sagittula sp. MA-2 TaxID=3048007 RepID=UPI0024C2BC61|nr:AI-2E family transporter [Sagittula sp. MA-2]WHZ35039.1 AI-2E family transporter [Sagittula sp. MA-2]
METTWSYTQTKVVVTALAIMATVALIAGLRLASDFAAPVALGLVVGVVLAPVVNRLSRFGVPRSLSAALALVIAVVLLVLLISALGPVLSGLAEQMPKIQREIREWMDEAIRLVRGVDSIGREIEETLSEGGEEAVKQAMPSLVDALWMAPNFAAQSLIFLGTLFFFVLTGEDIYNVFPRQAGKLKQADKAVSHYFITVTAINAGLGLAVFGAMMLIGLPNAMLWGGAAFLLNFVLYLGPIVLLASLLVAGVMNYSGASILLPPLAYLGLNMIEAQFVTPSLVGQQLRLNPLVVFLSILFGLWLWGPIGGIVSLPLLVWTVTLMGKMSFTSAESKMFRSA